MLKEPLALLYSIEPNLEQLTKDVCFRSITQRIGQKEAARILLFPKLQAAGIDPVMLDDLVYTFMDAQADLLQCFFNLNIQDVRALNSIAAYVLTNKDIDL